MRQKMSFGELPKEKGYLNEGEVLQSHWQIGVHATMSKKVVVLREFGHTRG